MNADILDFAVTVQQDDGVYMYQSDAVQMLQVRTIAGAMLHKNKIQITITLMDDEPLMKIPLDEDDLEEDEDDD